MSSSNAEEAEENARFHKVADELLGNLQDAVEVRVSPVLSTVDAASVRSIPFARESKRDNRSIEAYFAWFMPSFKIHLR